MPFYPDWLCALDDVANRKEGATVTASNARDIIAELHRLSSEVKDLRGRPRGVQIGDRNVQTNTFR